MQILNKAWAELKPYEFNNRTHPADQVQRIAESIKEFGFTQPLVIDEQGSIVIGHGRWLAAKELNLQNVPCVKLSNLTEQQIRALRIIDNKLQNDSSWMFNNLELELGWLEDNDFDLKAYGLDDLQTDLFDEKAEAEDDNYEQPEIADENVFIKTGDIIQLGRHRVMCGDSTRKEDVSELMGGQTVEMIFTSPPYSDMRDYGGANMDVDYIVNFIPSWSAYANYLVFNLGIQRKEHSIVEYWTAYLDKAKASYSKFLAWNVWWKTTISIGQQSAFMPIEHEWVFVFGNQFKDINRTETRKTPKCKELGTTRRQADGTVKFSSIGAQKNLKELGSVFHSNSELGENRKNHPATFPIELPSKYIGAVSNVNDLVADPFLGSGTTLIACEQLNRTCYGIEIEPKYCQVIIDRYKKHCEANNKEFICLINGTPFTERARDEETRENIRNS